MICHSLKVVVNVINILRWSAMGKKIGSCNETKVENYANIELEMFHWLEIVHNKLLKFQLQTVFGNITLWK